MKIRCYSIAILIGISQMLGAHTRLTPEKHHFLSVDGSVGYASLQTNASDIKSVAGTALSIGVGYRLYYNSFLLSVGLNGQYMYDALSVKDGSLQIGMTDTEGQAFTMLAEATQWKDLCHAGNFNIPVLVGAEYKRFYFLVGPEFSYNVWGQTETKAQLRTRGQYDRYIGIFDDMENHALYSRSIESGKQTLSWNIDLVAHAEIGWRLGEVFTETGADVPQSKHRFYMALYADYGLINIHKDVSQGERFGYKESSETGVAFGVTPTMLCNELHTATVHPYSVGIKVTYLFELPQHKQCVICRD